MAKRGAKPISKRDLSIIELDRQGKTSREIAKAVGTSHVTVTRILKQNVTKRNKLAAKDEAIIEKAHEKRASKFAENLTAGMEIAAVGFKRSLEEDDPRKAREYLDNAVGASKHTRLLRGEAEGREELIASPELISRIKTFREAKREA